MGAVAVYPLIYSVRASFHHYRFGLDFGSAGLQNYRNVLHDSTFWAAIWTTAKYVALAVTLETLIESANRHQSSVVALAQQGPPVCPRRAHTLFASSSSENAATGSSGVRSPEASQPRLTDAVARRRWADGATARRAPDALSAGRC